MDHTQDDNSVSDSGPLWCSDFGQLVLELEHSLLHEPLRRMHGETVVWSSDDLSGGELMSRCMVRHALRLGRNPAQIGQDIAATASCLTGKLEQLPFVTRSVNGMVLHHSLETVADPRTALREVTRVLAPGARLVLLGFNPFSFVGVRGLYNRWFSGPMAAHHLVNPLRLFDWLAVLGYELQAAPVYLGLGLPLRKAYESSDSARFPRWNQWRQQLLYGPQPSPFGAILLIEAVKQTTAKAQPWPHIKPRTQLAPVSYPRVAQWQRKSTNRLQPSGEGQTS